MPRREPASTFRLPAGVRATLRRLAASGNCTMAAVVVDSVELFSAFVEGKPNHAIAQQLYAIQYMYHRKEKGSGNG